MADEGLVAETLHMADGDLERLIDALAKASKEHARFITITISITSNSDEGDEDAVVYYGQ